MTGLNIQLKQTKELNEYDMDSLIALKQQYWNYSTNKQEKWFEKNIIADDYHILIYLGGGGLLAYLNAVNVEVDINYSQHRMMGIGNVCVDEKHTHTGVGSILMACINAFIKQSLSCGILLCKEKLIPFYESLNWQVLSSQQVTISGQPYKHIAMIYDPMRMAAMGESKCIINLSRNF